MDVALSMHRKDYPEGSYPASLSLLRPDLARRRFRRAFHLAASICGTSITGDHSKCCRTSCLFTFVNQRLAYFHPWQRACSGTPSVCASPACRSSTWQLLVLRNVFGRPSRASFFCMAAIGFSLVCRPNSLGTLFYVKMQLIEGTVAAEPPSGARCLQSAAKPYVCACATIAGGCRQWHGIGEATPPHLQATNCLVCSCLADYNVQALTSRGSCCHRWQEFAWVAADEIPQYFEQDETQAEILQALM